MTSRRQLGIDGEKAFSKGLRWFAQPRSVRAAMDGAKGVNPASDKVSAVASVAAARHASLIMGFFLGICAQMRGVYALSG